MYNTIPNTVKNSVFGSHSGLVLNKDDVAKLQHITSKTGV